MDITKNGVIRGLWNNTKVAFAYELDDPNKHKDYTLVPLKPEIENNLVVYESEDREFVVPESVIEDAVTRLGNMIIDEAKENNEIVLKGYMWEAKGRDGRKYLFRVLIHKYNRLLLAVWW